MRRLLLPALLLLFVLGCTPRGTRGVADANVEADTQGTADDAAEPAADVAPQGDVASPADTTNPKEEDAAVTPEETAESEDVNTPEETSAPEDAGIIDAAKSDENGCPLDAIWPQRILLIGNSYTGANGGLNKVLKSIMDAHICNPGGQAHIAKHSPGGVKIYQHYKQATAEGSALHKLLNDPEGWDVMVLQDQSQIPGFPVASSTEKAQTLELMDDWAALVEATGAQLMLFMTWGRRDGDPMNDWLYPNYTAMQNALADGYWAYAKAAEAGAEKTVNVIPVGLAWQSVHDNSAPISAADAAETQARFKSLYTGDGSHPSMRGTYLAAAVFLAELTGASASLGIWAPNGISQTDKNWLDSAASVAQ